MYLNLARSDSGTCEPGTGVYYICSSNGFKGCCTVDPCGLSTCPASGSNSVLTTVVLTAQPPSSTSNPGPATVTVFTERSTASSSLLGSQINSPATTSSRESSAIAAAATTAPLTSTQSSIPSLKSSSNRSALIAGVVVGIVVLAILSILSWFCIRRHQKSRDRHIARKSYVLGPPSPSKDFVLERSNSSEVETLHKSPNDIFALFGGRYKSPQGEPAELAHHPEAQDRIEEEVEEDRDLPDIEKSRVKTPPVHEHPAYAPPGQGRYQPSMSSHPAYHVSQLNAHPAFRNVRVSHVPQTRSHQSIHTSYQFAEPRAGQMDEVVSPLTSSPLMSSPIAGHSELEAEVPSAYMSPTLSSNPSRQSMIQQNRNSRKLRDHIKTDISSQKIPIGRKSASSSTRSVPIGLGVGVAPGSSSAPNLPLPALPSTFVPALNPAWRNSANTPRAHTRANSRQFISTGEEIVSKIQRPNPRASSNSLQNQPIVSCLERLRQGAQRNTTYSYAEEKEMEFSAPSRSSHPSQRWSDATMVTPAPMARRNQISLSVPSLIAAAGLAASPDPNTSSEEGSRPTSTYTEETATWGSWAAR